MSLEVRHILEVIFPRKSDLAFAIITQAEALLLGIEKPLTDIIAVHVAMTMVVTFLDEYITSAPFKGLR